jgi:antirestriction protein ArdC
MPEVNAAEASKRPSQNPDHAAHVRLPREIERLQKHIVHFEEAGDELEANDYKARLKHTQDRHAHVSAAKALVDQFGLSHDIHPDAITYNDALNFVAKTMHETQHGVTKSTYVRANHSSANDGKHISLDKQNAPRDPAAEVVEHLGLTDPQHIAAVQAFFSTTKEQG